MTQEKLNEILAAHKLWADNDANGVYANLRRADLHGTNLSGADLRGADLRGADLRRAELSGAKGLLSAADYMGAHFERAPDGYIAYKIFGGECAVPESWRVENGGVITENVNSNRTDECGCGINVAPLEWVKENSGRETRDIWRVLIRWEWLCGVCVPYNTTGNIRCERVELVEKVYG